jgi:hypothetical protein
VMKEPAQDRSSRRHITKQLSPVFQR